MIRYGFLTQAVVAHLEGELLELREPLIYRTRGIGGWPLPSDLEIRVPEGLVFDGASIPQFAWSFMPSKAQTVEEGALHDWAYRVGPHLGLRKRKYPDWLIYEALVLSNDGAEWQRQVIWRALRIAGWSAWNGYRKLDMSPDDPATLVTYSPAGKVWTN